MKRIFFLLITTLLLSFGTYSQQISALSFEEIVNFKTFSKDTVYIVNFWATWCAPCVEELPVFNSLYKHYADKPVKILLVSLDFKEDYPMKLATFVQRKKIKPEVIWLTDTNPNEYMPKVSKKWEGSIPATIVIFSRKNAIEFTEGQVNERQMTRIVDKMLE